MSDERPTIRCVISKSNMLQANSDPPQVQPTQDPGLASDPSTHIGLYAMGIGLDSPGRTPSSTSSMCALYDDEEMKSRKKIHRVWAAVKERLALRRSAETTSSHHPFADAVEGGPGARILVTDEVKMTKEPGPSSAAAEEKAAAAEEAVTADEAATAGEAATAASTPNSDDMITLAAAPPDWSAYNWDDADPDVRAAAKAAMCYERAAMRSERAPTPPPKDDGYEAKKGKGKKRTVSWANDSNEDENNQKKAKGKAKQRTVSWAPTHEYHNLEEQTGESSSPGLIRSFSRNLRRSVGALSAIQQHQQTSESSHSGFPRSLSQSFRSAIASRSSNLRRQTDDSSTSGLLRGEEDFHTGFVRSFSSNFRRPGVNRESNQHEQTDENSQSNSGFARSFSQNLRKSINRSIDQTLFPKGPR